MYSRIGAVWLAGSGIGFLIAVAFLFAAEGPSSPDILDTMSSASGRILIRGFIFAGIGGAILCPIGLTPMLVQLRRVNEILAMTSILLATMMAPIVVSFLVVEYAPVLLAEEGFETTERVFRAAVVIGHAAGDVGGWTTIGLLAGLVLTLSALLRQARRWPLVYASGFGLVIIALALFVLDASYLFLVPFGFWELALAGAWLGTMPVPVTSEG